ncbi:MAG: aminotransferase class I/II-fold pyridoxal phosphate-dependent enzyme [Thermoplasmata archaeon]|nr:aminotransferase class I/II-fold pyridoxal phosphate-dependent enzyme [Thermoplasmata archaeon]TFG70792.1 MAG: aminotransferase class I/II-fold pyridoxal phosphate-dependent enzyme [Methanomassiliicoccus sp.]
MANRNPVSFLGAEYDKLVTNELDWRLRILQGPSTPKCVVDGKSVTMLCSNNYLNLSNHPKVKDAAIEAIRSHGAGSGSVRPIAGNMDLHMELERRLAVFKNAEASLVYQTGFATNAGLIPQLVDEGDLMISDELNHGSIIDGVRLSKAGRAVYKHCDMDDLRKVLESAETHRPSYRRIMIITDGVFSMDGDMAPLDKIAALAHDHGAMVYVDDAHGEGVLGDGGRGIVSHFNLSRDDVHVEMGTFSKAFGVVGGHVSGSRDLVNFAYNKSRTWLLSGSHPPAVVAACIAAIDVLETEPKHVKNLWRNTERFREQMQSLGFDTGKSMTPIVPIMMGDSGTAKRFSARLYELGVFALPIVFPMVSKDGARIRTIMNSGLTVHDLDQAIDAFEKVGRELDMI